MNLTAPPLVRRDEHRGWMMDVSDHGGPLRTRDSGEQRVTPLELFFDLVFVFAVTQLSHLLLDHLSIRGVLETLFLLLAVWWAWVYTAWFTNWFDPDRLPVRLVLVAVMLASLLMSVAIPEAFGERGLMFALAFVAIQVGRTAFAVLALYNASHPLSGTFWRILTWLVAAGVLWVAGGLVEGGARYVLWLLARSLPPPRTLAGWVAQPTLTSSCRWWRGPSPSPPPTNSPLRIPARPERSPLSHLLSEERRCLWPDTRSSRGPCSGCCPGRTRSRSPR